METKIMTKEFADKVMEGLTIAVKKVIEEARKNNEPIVVSVDGKVQWIYP